jgi:hypothetical protein
MYSRRTDAPGWQNSVAQRRVSNANGLSSGDNVAARYHLSAASKLAG